MSVLHLYRRIFWSARWFRVAWWVNIVYINLWVLASFFTELLQCLPVSFYWNRVYLDLPVKTDFAPRGHCKTPNFINYMSILNVVSSFGIWAMPMVALFRLQMKPRKKIELGFLLSLGAWYVEWYPCRVVVVVLERLELSVVISEPIRSANSCMTLPQRLRLRSWKSRPLAQGSDEPGPDLGHEYHIHLVRRGGEPDNLMCLPSRDGRLRAFYEAEGIKQRVGGKQSARSKRRQRQRGQQRI